MCAVVGGGIFIYFRFTWANAHRLHKGMSKSQVEKVMGPPASKKDLSWSYNEDDSKSIFRRPGWVDLQFDANGVLTHIDKEP
jgi:hypothetical protein